MKTLLISLLAIGALHAAPEPIFNGTTVLEYESDTAKDQGPIGLQVHQGLLMKIEFRNLKIEELKGGGDSRRP